MLYQFLILYLLMQNFQHIILENIGYIPIIKIISSTLQIKIKKVLRENENLITDNKNMSLLNYN